MLVVLQRCSLWGAILRAGLGGELLDAWLRMDSLCEQGSIGYDQLSSSTKPREKLWKQMYDIRDTRVG